MKLTHVMADDWEGLYMDGKIVDQGHTINWQTMIENIFGVSVESVEANYEWLEKQGYYPVNLVDVILE